MAVALFYSPTVGSFYDDTINQMLPRDAVEVSVMEHAALLHSQSQGKMIVAGKDGAPVAQDRPPSPGPTMAEQAAAALDQAIIITCDSNPDLNGSYVIDAAAQSQIIRIASAITAGLGLPGGNDTFNFPDAGGAARNWSPAKFMAFAKTVANYVYELELVVRGASDTIPVLPVSMS